MAPVLGGADLHWKICNHATLDTTQLPQECPGCRKVVLFDMDVDEASMAEMIKETHRVYAYGHQWGDVCVKCESWEGCKCTDL